MLLMEPWYLPEITNPNPDTDWIILLAVLVFLVHFLGRMFFPNYHRRVQISFFNDYEAVKLISEKRTNLPRESMLFALNTTLILALFVYEQMTWLYHPALPVNPMSDYLKLLAILVMYLVFRLFISAAFGWLFQIPDLSSRFNQIWLVNYQFLGFYGMIPVFIVPFLSTPLRLVALILIWLTLSAWLIYSVIRELKVLKTIGINLFYKILYLCTLEILPVWWGMSALLKDI